MGHYRYRRLFPVAIIVLAALLFHCSKKPGSPPEVFRDKPLIENGGYVSFEKLFSIDVTENGIFSQNMAFKQFVAFDDHEGMYIADVFKGKISVFDEHGNLEFEFGGVGQGPREFSSQISRILIDRERLMVFYGFNQIKNLSLEGDFISQSTHKIENPLNIVISNDDDFVLRAKFNQDFKQMDFILSLYDKNLSKQRDLLTYHYPPGLDGPNYDYMFSNWMLVTNHNRIYYSEDNLERYSLNQVDNDGILVKKFGRTYDIKHYSSEAEARFKQLYQKSIERGERTFPSHPPVIRLMFEDERGNVWVVSGETSEDNGNPDFENTVDIFNPKGEWMYSLKTKIVSRYVLYYKGKIYRVRVMDEEPYKQFIDVYKIAYND